MATPRIRIVFAVLSFLLLVPCVSAAQIDDPESVSEMRAEVIQSGFIMLKSQSAFALAEHLQLNLYVPQSDSRQTTTIKRVIGTENYTRSEDEHGNEMIVLSWKNPPLDHKIDYAVETEVRTTVQPSMEKRSFPVTDVVSPTRGIIDTAYRFGADKSLRNALRLAEWVNGYVTYDKSCEREAYSAEWVYDSEVGTCDEFSNLLLSMLKVLGYQAWYVVGYAYLGKQEAGTSFGSHAWVELFIDSKTYGIDPTWAESPLDATHITFARLPDSNFTEHTEAKSRDVLIEWEKYDTRVNMLDFKTGRLQWLSFYAVPQEARGGKHALLIAEFDGGDCTLTNGLIGGCIDTKGEPMVSIDDEKKPLIGCGGSKFYWLAEMPDVARGMFYRCPVSLGIMGERTSANLSISNDGPSIDLSISMQKTATPGQQIPVKATLRSSEFTGQRLKVYVLLGNQVSQHKTVELESRGSGSVTFTMTAPDTAGDYNMRVFSSSGDLATSGFKVVESRDAAIEGMELPDSIGVSEPTTLNVTVKNLGEAGKLKLTVKIDGYERTTELDLPEGGTQTVGIEYSGEDPGKRQVTAALFRGDDYQDGWAGAFNVAGKTEALDDIFSIIIAFFQQLISELQMFFQDLGK